MTQLAAVQVVVPALAGLREEHPQVRVRLIERTTAPLEQMLEAGTLDVAFLHPPLHTPGLSQSELTRAPLVRIAPGTDETFVRPLVRYPRGEAPVLMGDVERSSRDWDGQAPEVEADTMLGAVVLSRAGFGACVVADDYARSLGLRERVPDVTDLDVTIATSVAWRRLDRRSLVTALVSTATERTSEGSRS